MSATNRRLVYLSNQVQPFDLSALEALVDSARRFNVARDVTGALVYAGEGFIQLLEGEPQAVDEVMARVQADRRHRVAAVLIDERDRPRLFAGFSMHHDAKTQPQGTGEFRQWLAHRLTGGTSGYDIGVELLVRFWEDRATGGGLHWSRAWTTQRERKTHAPG